MKQSCHMAESKSAPFILTDLYSYSVGSGCNYKNKICFKSCLAHLEPRIVFQNLVPVVPHKSCSGHFSASQCSSCPVLPVRGRSRASKGCPKNMSVLIRKRRFHNLLTSPSPSPSPKSKPQIQRVKSIKGKGKLDSGLSLKSYGPTPNF